MKNKSETLAFTVGLLFIIAIAVKTIINVNNINDLTLYQINERRSYFPKPIARLFTNKLQTALNLSVKEVFTLFPREI